MATNDQYLRLQVSAADILATIQTYRYVVHTEGRRGTTLNSNNHATLYLILSAACSVQINLRHAEDDLNGRLEIVSRSYGRSRTEVTHQDFEPGVASATVRDVIAEVYKMKDFEFSGGGMGCKFWQTIMSQILESRGWLTTGTALRVHAFLSYQYSTLQSPVHQIIVPGTFDEQQARNDALTAWTSLVQSTSEKLRPAERILQLLTTIQQLLRAPDGHQQARDLILACRGHNIVFDTPQDLSSRIDAAAAAVSFLVERRDDLLETARRFADLTHQRQEEDENSD